MQIHTQLTTLCSVYKKILYSISLPLFFLFMTSKAFSADECLANPDWGIILTDHGYSDVLMDLRVVNGVNYRGREYLSGEYAHAISYLRNGLPVAPIWLEPDFIFPDWTTNSTFTVITPLAMIGINGSGLPVMESVIANADLEITITSEMVDNGPVGVQNGMTAASSASVTVAPITSNKYIMVQRYEYKNISGVEITNLGVIQMLHGLVSLVSLHDDRAYPPAGTDPFSFDAVFTNDTTVIGQDGVNGSYADPATCIPGAIAGTPLPGIEHFDVLTMHTPAVPDAIDSSYYGDRSAGDDHVTGKPSIGTHINIETGTMNASDFFDPGDADYPPDTTLTPTYGDTLPEDFWVAGAQAHIIGDLMPNDMVAFDYLLSLQTATVKVPMTTTVPLPLAYLFLMAAGLLGIGIRAQKR